MSDTTTSWKDTTMTDMTPAQALAESTAETWERAARQGTGSDYLAHDLREMATLASRLATRPWEGDERERFEEALIDAVTRCSTPALAADLLEIRVHMHRVDEASHE